MEDAQFTVFQEMRDKIASRISRAGYSRDDVKQFCRMLSEDLQEAVKLEQLEAGTYKRPVLEP